MEIKQRRTEQKLQLMCEGCTTTVKRWEMEMVKASDQLEITRVLQNQGEDVLFNFACPSCVEQYALEPLHHEMASKFRKMNARIQQVVEPNLILQ